MRADADDEAPERRADEARRLPPYDAAEARRFGGSYIVFKPIVQGWPGRRFCVTIDDVDLQTDCCGG